MNREAERALALPKAGDLKVLIAEPEIKKRVREMGQEITRDFRGQSILLLGILKGACIFLSDLAREIRVETTFDFLAVSSYGLRGESSGHVTFTKQLTQPLAGKNVIVAEDILDTGVTLRHLRELIQSQAPRTLSIAGLLDKPARRKQTIKADYVGFKIDDHFVVGYGMDFAEHYRNLRDIRIVPAEVVALGDKI